MADDVLDTGPPRGSCCEAGGSARAVTVTDILVGVGYELRVGSSAFLAPSSVSSQSSLLPLL